MHLVVVFPARGDVLKTLGVGLSIGTALAQSGTVAFSNSNSVSFGVATYASGMIMTLSAGVTGGLAAAIQSLSAGTTQVTSGQAVLSNSNGISFGANGQTITGDLQRVSRWYNGAFDFQFALQTTIASRGAELRFERVTFGRPVTFTAGYVAGDFEGSQAAGSYTLAFGLYSMNGSTATLLTASSLQRTWNSSTNASSSCWGGITGSLRRSASLSFAVTPGDYLLGVMWSGTDAGNSIFRLLGRDFTSISNSVPYFCYGYYSTTSPAGLPASVQLSEIVQSGANAVQGLPLVELAGTF
jgi:hypothetical protein